MAQAPIIDAAKQRLKFLKKKRAHKRRHSVSLIGAAPVKNEINVTPLVDVVLVLLIIFMVVTPMLSRGVKVEPPETVHHSKKNDNGEQVIISIQADGHVFVDTDQADGNMLVDRLKVAMKAHPGAPVHVKGDKHLDYGVVRRVLEMVHESGAPNVALGTEERKKDGESGGAP